MIRKNKFIKVVITFQFFSSEISIVGRRLPMLRKLLLTVKKKMLMIRKCC